MKLEIVTSYLKHAEQLTGLPLWAVITISVICLIFVFLYGVFIPISIVRMKRRLNHLINVLSDSQEKAQRNLHGQSSNYRWRT